MQVSDVQQGSRQFIDGHHVSLPGLDEENSLLPRDTRYFSGFALLGEYFHFPEKFLFVQMSDLTKGLSRQKADECILTIFLSEADQELIGRVSVDDFSLNCAPAINLFSRRTDRMRLDTQHEEHHLLVDRTRPADFEVYSVESVSGFSEHNEEHRFARLYDSVGQDLGFSSGAFFSQRFDKRLTSSSARKFGARSAYMGSEVFLSLVDQNEAPYPASMKHLEAQVFCTNRDLPINIAVGRGSTDFSLDINAPVSAIRAKAGPTRPKEGLALGEGALTWRAVNHLSTNYLSLVEGSPGNGARAIRDLLALYGDESDSTIRRQIESLQSVAARRVTRRLPTDGPITYGRGLQVTLKVDESGFAGFGSFLLTRVLERFFSRYVSINSFTETRVVFTDSKEEIVWPPTVGHRHLL
jgi:type VI secretion system protein ImpG